MTTILCPTRGGEGSTPNQEAAISLAIEKDARLLFLYVSNIHFLDHTAGPLDLEVIENQLDEVGDFILAMAEEKALSRGIDVLTRVKRGVFGTALEEVIAEFPDISIVVFGSAIEGTGATTPAYIEPLYRRLVTDLGIEVLVTREGEFVEHYRPGESASES